MPDGPWTLARDGLRVAVRLTPRAKANRLFAVSVAADGRRMIKASVTAPPEDGRANEALLRLLARVWGLPRRDLMIVAGAASGNKTVCIAGDPQQLSSRLNALLWALPGH